jgi:dolichol-phosphate mannosyltransferase
MHLLSVITPAYNEEANLPVLYERLVTALEKIPLRWEWIVIDDHSADTSFSLLSEIARADSRLRAIRFARNSGAHAAVACGLEHCNGDCAVVLAADLQDPPEVISDLVDRWYNGAQIVWAARRRREGEKMRTIAFSRLYYWMMRRFVGIKNMPARGADFFLIDRRVIRSIRNFGESNVSLFALLTWLGFRQEEITYDKQARLHGESGWSVEKKLKLVADSITAFTYMPIRLMSYAGAVIACLGFLYACFLIIHAIAGNPVEGWTSLMVIVLVLGGVQMLMMGVLGEYLWRALDEARRRPKYIIESTLNFDEK